VIFDEATIVGAFCLLSAGVLVCFFSLVFVTEYIGL